ncbi:MAG: hypothetical protein JWN48_5292 [Myxococcaceae bacterium]|nr:hypothetical protein [Myxococcaceae bacterium]
MTRIHAWLPQGCWSLLAVLGGCTEPLYTDAGAARCEGSRCDAGLPADAYVGAVAEDGGMAPEGSARPLDEAGVTLQPGLPAGADLLQGKYGVRARFFASNAPDSTVRFSHDIVFLADVRPDAAGQALEMHVQLCQDLCNIKPIALLPESNTEVLSPQHWPARTYTLHIEQGRFYTTEGTIAVGYEPKRPVDCESGAVTAASSPAQSWNDNGLCECRQSDPLPLVASDCRINDSDLDHRAAMTVLLLSGGQEIYSSVRLLDSSQILNGTLDSKRRHTAQYLKVEDYWVVACEPDSCANSPYTYCNPAFQPVLFEPLDARADGSEWSCADVLTAYESGRFFTPDRIVFPSGC